MKVGFCNLGCKVNLYESEYIASLFKERGYEIGSFNETCDIYAAGKIFAYLLSGKNPAEPPYEVEQFCKGLKGISQAYVEIIERCLEPQPQARYESCESLIREIRRAFDEKSHKKSWKIPQKRTCCYKKCIWKSEYRRIF